MEKKTVKEIIAAYMSKIGSVGGKKSRRILTTEQSRALLKIRWAKRKKKKK